MKIDLNFMQIFASSRNSSLSLSLSVLFTKIHSHAMLNKKALSWKSVFDWYSNKMNVGCWRIDIYSHKQHTKGGGGEREKEVLCRFYHDKNWGKRACESEKGKKGNFAKSMFLYQSQHVVSGRRLRHSTGIFHNRAQKWKFFFVNSLTLSHSL
jgi:hypothetical protein